MPPPAAWLNKDSAGASGWSAGKASWTNARCTWSNRRLSAWLPARNVAGGGTGGGAADARTRLDTALTEAREAIERGEAALAAGDFAAYGEAQDALDAALADAIAAEAELG